MAGQVPMWLQNTRLLHGGAAQKSPVSLYKRAPYFRKRALHFDKRALCSDVSWGAGATVATKFTPTPWRRSVQDVIDAGVFVCVCCSVVLCVSSVSSVQDVVDGGAFLCVCVRVAVCVVCVFASCVAFEFLLCVPLCPVCATHCNTLHHTAIHRNTTNTNCVPRVPSMPCLRNTLLHTAANSVLRVPSVPRECNTPQHTATHKALTACFLSSSSTQHAATNCKYIELTHLLSV